MIAPISYTHNFTESSGTWRPHFLNSFGMEGDDSCAGDRFRWAPDRGEKIKCQTEAIRLNGNGLLVGIIEKVW